ncbi:MAG: hypothetical protein ACK54F_07865 [Planctomycetia bacterium]|jgi:hypothetical protein
MRRKTIGTVAAVMLALAAETPPPMRFVGLLRYLSFHTPYLFPAEAGPRPAQ